MTRDKESKDLWEISGTNLSLHSKGDSGSVGCLVDVVAGEGRVKMAVESIGAEDGMVRSYGWGETGFSALPKFVVLVPVPVTT